MSEEFRVGVKIVLARIDSHPEEFKEEFGKWEDIMNAVRDRMSGLRDRMFALTDEEVEAIYTKLRAHIWGPKFDDIVMQKVLDPDREERVLQEAQAYSNSPVGIRRPPQAYKTPVTQEEMIKEHLKAHRALMAQGQPIK